MGPTWYLFIVQATKAWEKIVNVHEKIAGLVRDYGQTTERKTAREVKTNNDREQTGSVSRVADNDRALDHWRESFSEIYTYSAW